MLSERDLERIRRREAQRSARRERELAARRLAIRSGAVGMLVAAMLPWVLWRETIAQLAAAFEPTVTYFVTAWSPWALMTCGILCFVPAFVRLRASRRRFYGAGSGAWFGWGITLYLLGFALATQVAQIADGMSAL